MSALYDATQNVRTAEDKLLRILLKHEVDPEARGEILTQVRETWKQIGIMSVLEWIQANLTPDWEKMSWPNKD